ncbi:unnamed protein product [Absidia cylindrospora]
MGYYVRSLVLDSNICTDTQLLLLMTHIRHLETLSIQNMVFANDHSPITSTSLRYCSQLVSLKLSHTILSDATIRAIGQHCRQLCELTVNSSLGLPDYLLSALVNCPLKRLDLCYPGTDGMLTEKMVMDMTRFQALTYLRISLCEPSSLIMTIANNNNTTTAPCWPDLKTFSLDSCNDIDDVSFICFIKSHPHLQFISLDNRTTLTDASLDAMAVSLHNLRKCFLGRMNGISSGGVRRLIQKCQRLVLIRFQECDQIVASDVLETLDDNNNNYLYLNEHDIARVRSAHGTGNVH